MLVDKGGREQAPKRLQVAAVDDGEGGEDRVGGVAEGDAGGAQRQAAGGGEGRKLELNLLFPALCGGCGAVCWNRCLLGGPFGGLIALRREALAAARCCSQSFMPLPAADSAASHARFLGVKKGYHSAPSS